MKYNIYDVRKTKSTGFYQSLGTYTSYTLQHYTGEVYHCNYYLCIALGKVVRYKHFTRFPGYLYSSIKLSPPPVVAYEIV